MTYSGIDRKRFTYLLSLGTDELELRKFFTDCRVQLIQHGGKVQNLPQGTNARIRTLAVELPPSTDKVVRAWFAKHLTMVDPEEAEAVVGVYERYEELSEKLPEDSARRYARSCLVHLFSENPARSLLDFLKTPIGGASKEKEEAIDIAEAMRETSPPAPYPENLPRVLVDLVEGRDADEHLEGLPPALGTFISGLQAGILGETKNARDAVDALAADAPLHNLLEQFLKQQEAKAASSESSRRGLWIPSSVAFEGPIDYERDEALAYCTKSDRASAVFVHPIAIVRGEQIHFLTDDNRRQLFPDTGDLIAFAGTGRPRQPTRGEVGVWRVAEHETDKATRFHLASDKRPVYEVRQVPFPSTDYDSVREFLKEHAERTGGNSLQPPLFQLNDGLIVGGRGERPDLTRDESFESGLLAWKSLPALRLEGRLFVVGPLPKEQSVYECAGLASAVRKLFRSHLRAEKTAGGLTRAQLRELAQSLGSKDAGLDALRIHRIKVELERLEEQVEALDALVVELMNHPSVKQRIDKHIEEEASKQLSHKNTLQADISRLREERGEWEERIRKQREEHRKVRDETVKVVKAAFEKARAEGVSTLADLAVFQALSAPATVPLSAGIAQPIVRDLTPTDQDVISMLRSLGVPAQRATAFSALGEAALKAGLIVSVRGIAARLVVEGWAKAIGGAAVLFDSTIGLIDVGALTSVLTRVPTHDVLALLDANLSALDIYARPISDLVLARLACPDGEARPAILLALADGIGSLPFPKTFEGLSVSLDLERRYVFRSVSDLDEMMSMVTNPEDGTLYSQLWRPAADRLLTQIYELEPEARALILSVLATQ